jgi:serine/threonine protein kinase
MELCEGHTLAEVISRKGRLTEEEAMKIFRKILSGCLTITQNCIIHRDLKPTNILISSTFEPKVIDFGFCEVIQSKKVMRTFNVGSPSYMAP